MRKTIYLIVSVTLTVSLFVSCNDNKKTTEMLRRSTELAIQRTDSISKIKEDSLSKAKVIERRRADSIAKVDSLRRIYERNHITLEGTVGGETARLRLNRSGDAVSGTYSGSGLQVTVHGTWSDGVIASGKQTIDSVTYNKVSINIQRTKEDEFTGSVTISKSGETSTQRASFQRY